MLPSEEWALQRAKDRQLQAETQAEHFLQQRMAMEVELSQVKAELQQLLDQWKEACEEADALKRMLKKTQAAGEDIRPGTWHCLSG